MWNQTDAIPSNFTTKMTTRIALFGSSYIEHLERFCHGDLKVSHFPSLVLYPPGEPLSRRWQCTTFLDQFHQGSNQHILYVNSVFIWVPPLIQSLAIAFTSVTLYYVLANNQASGDTVRMHTIAWAFAARRVLYMHPHVDQQVQEYIWPGNATITNCRLLS